MTFIELVEATVTWRTFAEVCALIFVYKWGYGAAEIKSQQKHKKRAEA